MCTEDFEKNEDGIISAAIGRPELDNIYLELNQNRFIDIIEHS